MHPIRKAVIGAVLVGSTLTGGAIGAALISGTAGAQESTDSTTSTDATTAAPAAAPDPSKGGHMANGIAETLLTGDTADKVTAAALAAVPGGSIQRVENDAEGATYEAHMTDADGQQVTVKLDAAFDVTSTEQGHR
jgi:uncharacterized membrane protein YkoI